MEKIFAIILSVTLALSLAGCGTKTPAPEKGGETGQVQIANPFVSCDNMTAAAELAGFEITLPQSLPNWITETEIRVIEGEMIEVVSAGEDGKELRIRKAVGSEDISGDYNSYEEASEITVGELTVALKGHDDKINVATWSDGKYTFSIVCSEGLSQDNISAMVTDIK